ncbi:hypothetical protein DIPPA_14667 [Diplonema papillatum]|nr:hypothetical protein DIPPA_14667 [Diplonema papillatum]
MQGSDSAVRVLALAGFVCASACCACGLRRCWKGPEQHTYVIQPGDLDRAEVPAKGSLKVLLEADSDISDEEMDEFIRARAAVASSTQ